MSYINFLSLYYESNMYWDITFVTFSLCSHWQLRGCFVRCVSCWTLLFHWWIHRAREIKSTCCCLSQAWLNVSTFSWQRRNTLQSWRRKYWRSVTVLYVMYARCWRRKANINCSDTSSCLGNKWTKKGWSQWVTWCQEMHLAVTFCPQNQYEPRQWKRIGMLQSIVLLGQPHFPTSKRT